MSPHVQSAGPDPNHVAPNLDAPFPDMVWIPSATYQMGSDHHYPEERPVHKVTVDGFWMDRTPVTVAAFQPFAENLQVQFAHAVDEGRGAG